jgi:hypothetical protein
VQHYNWNRAGRLTRGTGGSYRRRNDDVDLARRHLARELAEAFRIAVCRTLLDHDGLAFNIAERG